MKLATIAEGTRDGRLVIVSANHTRAVPAEGIAVTLQDALDRWDQVEPALQSLSATMAGATVFDAATALAPLPRAWQGRDGSAFESHGDLMQKVFGMDPSPKGRPLMYQGLSEALSDQRGSC